MRDFKFSKETSTIALVFFFIYFTYGIFRLPFVQYLVSMAVGAITYGICESYELAVVALLVMNLIFPMISGPSGPKGPSVQGFVSKTKEGFMATNPSEISARVGHMKNTGIRGVGSPMSEGFEDAASNDMSLSENKTPSENSEEVTATSKPASAESTTANATATASESFKDNSGLFKLGEIPTETKGGFHIDDGTTVMNALKALKPDQIDAMTKDTKQLIETQKSLMNMLQTFTPMVKEGKQMMETFGSMFNPAGGAAMGSLQASQGMMNAA
jgi:hypothetical protein